jgi:hypothetical protein
MRRPMPLKQYAKRAINHSYNKKVEKEDWDELMDDRKAREKGLKPPKPMFLKKIGEAVRGEGGLG